jgi:hypothetical protein
MKTGRIVLVLLGAVLAFIGIGLLAGGGALVWAHSTQRDADGYYTSPAYELASDGHAVTAGHVHLSGVNPGDWTPDLGDVAVRITVRSTAEAPVFVGIAAEDDLATYLAGVAHDDIDRLGDRADEVTYDTVTGTAVPAPPGDQDFWVATAEGTGAQTVTWQAEAGTWSLVVMNATGAAGVEVVAIAAARVPFLFPIGIGLLITGLVLAGLAAGLMIAGAARGQGATTRVGDVTVSVGPYPLRLEGALDPGLSRWQWLVKWFLAIPHFVVLAFLWAAFAVMTVVAGVAILFTGGTRAGSSTSTSACCGGPGA